MNKRIIIDGTVLLFLVVGIMLYLFNNNIIIFFIFFILAIAVGWFRRALYKIMPSW